MLPLPFNLEPRIKFGVGLFFILLCDGSLQMNGHKRRRLFVFFWFWESGIVISHLQVLNTCLGSFLYMPIAQCDKLRLLPIQLESGKESGQYEKQTEIKKILNKHFTSGRSNMVWSWMIKFNLSCMPCNTIDRLITGYLFEWLLAHRNVSSHKYARSTTRSTALFGTVSLFCMVAPLMSSLDLDATITEVAPLFNPTLSWKLLSIPKRILTIYFLGCGYNQWDRMLTTSNMESFRIRYQ